MLKRKIFPIFANCPITNSLPTSYHNGACGFAFADGHSEIKRWLDRRTIQPVRRAAFSPPNQSNNRDVEWLWSKTTQRLQ
jgi:prepilin-type processing-associated H-X9-DG protein